MIELSLAFLAGLIAYPIISRLVRPIIASICARFNAASRGYD
jgi:hypothetical protein